MSGPLYHIRGIVTHGKGRGRTVGMPTANLELPSGSRLPPEGVYVTEVYLDEARYPGVTNVGTRPSVDDDRHPTVETLVLGFSGDLYGREMSLDFHLFLRPVRKFESLQAVRDQVEKDSRTAMAYFANCCRQSGEGATP